jgi:MFS family permease
VGRIRTTASVFGAAFRNAALLRLELAWVSFNGAEWGVWLALLVWAYTHGGPTTTSIIVLVQLVPCILLSPFLGALTDRRRAGRVLFWSYLVMALSMGGLAAAVALGAPRILVFALAPIVNLAISAPRPAQSALLPGVVRSPVELTAANVVSSWMENGSVLVAPALTGVLLGIGGPALAMGALAVIALVGAFLVFPLPGPPPLITSEERRSLFADVREGIRAVSRVPSVRVLIGVLGSQYILVGALDVLYVVLAISVLGMGEAGSGYLNSAFGAGGMIGAAVTALLVARRHLAPALLAGIVTAALALGLLGLYPSVAGAFVLLAVAGLSRTVLDVTGRILLQRATPPGILAQVFSLLESLMDTGLAFGAIMVPVLVGLSGARVALLGVGAVFLLILAVSWRRLWQIDAAADVPQVEISLLRSIPLFSPLPAPALEGLARALEPLAVPAGTRVITEGDAGDRYYAVASGEVEVTHAGQHVARLGRGEGFGEIALIQDVPRTATVTALRDSDLYGLEKEPFILTLTGHQSAAERASAMVSRRLSELGAAEREDVPDHGTARAGGADAGPIAEGPL